MAASADDQRRRKLRRIAVRIGGGSGNAFHIARIRQTDAESTVRALIDENEGRAQIITRFRRRGCVSVPAAEKFEVIGFVRKAVERAADRNFAAGEVGRIKKWKILQGV